ncbi:uncharacterized protein LOC124164124 isoform X2 [Ischnura elegans]|uniref:uncharacterized protein LOC124164124 isoform X2 n=1 Tax=Ischnura elegans TaxID=197161 RepID=UPI001ED8B20C|nr:uncharacterized protein LOC124164124 isoform X2 [Ischnura elegans]XP_046397264.1 uncharacterized protein LOC124164124 isoform X2 [Ischnura elegans]
MESKNFTYSMDIRLIYLVKKHPYLYKASDAGFRDANLKNRVWEEIAKSMSKTVTECKTRWRTIRDSYRKNKKKARLDDDAPSRSKYDDDNLRFLDDVPMKERRKLPPKAVREQQSQNGPIYVQAASFAVQCNEESLGTEGADSPAEMIPENSAQDEESIDIKLEHYPLSESDPLMPDCGEDSSVSLPHSSVSLPPPQPSVEQVAGPGPGAFHELRRDIDERFHVLQEKLSVERRTDGVEHPVEIFFRSMASTVMTFSPRLMAEAKVRVCQIISELELRNLAEDPRNWK